MATDYTKMNLAAEALFYELKTNPAAEGRISDMLVGLFQTASGVLKNAFSDKINAIPMLKFAPEFNSVASYNKITPANFADFASRKVVASDGFVGNYIEYGNLLISLLNYKTNVLDKALDFYQQNIGSIFNSKDARKSWAEFTHRYMESVKQREQQNTEVAKFFGAGVDSSLVPIGSVIDRVADLHTLDAMARIIQGTLSSIKLVAIKARVDVINDLVLLLAEDISNKRIDGISGAQVNNLAAGVMELAHQVEHFAMIYYRASVFLQMVTRLEEVSKEVV